MGRRARGAGYCSAPGAEAQLSAAVLLPLTCNTLFGATSKAEVGTSWEVGGISSRHENFHFAILSGIR
jgi:hypothetical protein